MKIERKNQNNFKRILLIEKMSELEKRTFYFIKLQETLLDVIIKKSGVPKQYFNNEN